MAEIGKDIKKAKQLLEAGQLVGIPTETVYGLAGNGLRTDAVARIFDVKNRPRFDPVILHIPSFAKASLYTKNIPGKAMNLAEAFWPGALTILLEKKDIISDLVTAGLSQVGLRCPDHPLTQTLLQELNFPLAAPSANPFGYVSPTTPQHVNEQLGEKIPYILDGGPCRVGIESTIVGFEKGTGVLYRTGGLSREALEKVIGPVTLRTQASSNPETPGQLQSHYAPAKEIIVGNLDELIPKFRTSRIGILTFQKDYNLPYQYILSPEGSLEEAARNFFSFLRAFDKLPIEVILAEYAPDTGLGVAINDRLRRASFKTN
jgi:L-threonylcarbamoyladenylate synthase